MALEPTNQNQTTATTRQAEHRSYQDDKEAVNTSPSFNAPEDSQLGGWGDIGSGIAFSVPTTLGSGRLYEAIEKIREIIKDKLAQQSNQAMKLETTVFPLDPETNNKLIAPLAVLCSKVRGSNRVGYYTIVIDNGDYINRVSDVEVRGEAIQIRRLPSAAIRHSGVEVFDLVKQNFPNHHYSEAAGSVLPQEMDLEDKKSLDAFISNAINCCGAFVTLDMDTPDLNVMRIPNHETLVSTSQLVKNPRPEQIVRNEAGMPVRADIRTRLHTQGRRDPNGINDINPELISESAGYLDLIYNPINDGDDRKTTYVGAFIATVLNTPRRNSIGGILLAIYGSLSVFKDRYALYSLLPDRTANEDQAILQDIGTLNIEANLDGKGKPIPKLASVTTRESEVREYIDRLVHPVIDYHIDIDQCGPNTGRLYNFLAAAFDDQDALSSIMTSANELTGGHFENLWEDHVNPFSVVAVRPSGYFRAGNVNEDLRRNDYVSTFNLSKEDSTVIEDWQAYQFDLGLDENVRLYHQYKMLEALTPSAVINGLTYRISVDLAFLDALAQGMARAGLKVNFVIPNSRGGRDRYTPGGTRDRRAYGDLESRIRSNRFDDRRGERGRRAFSRHSR